MCELLWYINSRLSYWLSGLCLKKSLHGVFHFVQFWHMQEGIDSGLPLPKLDLCLPPDVFLSQQCHLQWTYWPYRSLKTVQNGVSRLVGVKSGTSVHCMFCIHVQYVDIPCSFGAGTFDRLLASSPPLAQLQWKRCCSFACLEGGNCISEACFELACLLLCEQHQGTKSH